MVKALYLKSIFIFVSIVTLIGLVLVEVTPPPAMAQADEAVYFPQTGKTLSGKFLNYWRSNGGLPVYGYPITEAQTETDPETGKTFLTQWFERNRFELHPENAGTKYEVQLGLLGKELRREALTVDPWFLLTQPTNDPSLTTQQQKYFPETSHNLELAFLDYWQNNGALERFGYPLDEAHPEVDPETGKTYLMQWFERARFEFHPENSSANQVLLGLLGNQLKAPKTNSTFVWSIGEDYKALVSSTALAVDPQDNLYVVDEFVGRVVKLDSSGRFLRRWGSFGKDNGQFDFDIKPGIAIDNKGQLYISERGNHRVQKFDLAGQYLLGWSTEDKQKYYSGPEALAVDPAGNVFVADLVGEDRRIAKFDQNGQLLAKWGGSAKSFGIAGGLVADKQGNLYMSDITNHRIVKFDNNGQVLTQWGTKGDKPGQFNSPEGLALDGQGNLYVADSLNFRIEKFDANGQFVTAWGGRNDPQLKFDLPQHLAVDSQGNLYVQTGNDYRIQKLDSSGKLVATIDCYTTETATGGIYAAGRTHPTDYFGVATDQQGHLYVTNIEQSRVEKYDAQGHLLTTWGSYGSGEGQFGGDFVTGQIKGPTAIAVGEQGEVYVVDSANSRIEKFDSEGHFLGQWGQPGIAEGEFYGIIAIAIDKEGNIYAGDAGNTRIQKFDSNRHFLAKWGSEGSQNGQFRSVSGIAIDSQGQVYVSDNSGKRVQKFDSQGKFLAKWDNRPNDYEPRFNKPGGLAVDSQDRLYLSDYGNDTVQQFDTKGNLLALISAKGSAEGLVTDPKGLALDQQGNLYIADNGNFRIQKIQLHS